MNRTGGPGRHRRGGGLRVTTTTKRSYFPRIRRAISNNSKVRHEARMAFTSAENPASSG
jgi:hypothetical protein